MSKHKEYYTPITEDEYLLKKPNFQRLDRLLVLTLNKAFSQFYFTIHGNYSIHMIFSIDIKTRETSYINKDDDEWFYIMTSNYRYYRCDQIDGLIRCITVENFSNKRFIESKVFESDYYTDFSTDWDSEGIFNIAISMSKTEIDTILDRVRVSYKSDLLLASETFRKYRSGSDFEYCTIRVKSYPQSSVNPTLLIEIVKTADDWYYVNNSYWTKTNPKNINKSYKCDQIDGVVELINHIFKNNDVSHINEGTISSMDKTITQEEIDTISDYCLTGFETLKVKEGKFDDDTDNKDNWDGYYLIICRDEIIDGEYRTIMDLIFVMWAKSIGVYLNSRGDVDDIDADKYGPFFSELNRLYDRIRSLGYLVVNDYTSTSLNRGGVCTVFAKIYRDNENS